METIITDESEISETHVLFLTPEISELMRECTAYLKYYKHSEQTSDVSDIPDLSFFSNIPNLLEVVYILRSETT